MSDRFHVFKTKKPLKLRPRPRDKAFFTPSSFFLIATTGTFLVTGSAVTFSANFITVAAAYTVTGGSITWPGLVGSGSYTVTGMPANLVISYLWNAATEPTTTWTPATEPTTTWTVEI